MQPDSLDLLYLLALLALLGHLEPQELRADILQGDLRGMDRATPH